MTRSTIVPLSTSRLFRGMVREGVVVGIVFGTLLGIAIGIPIAGSYWIEIVSEEASLGYGSYFLTLAILIFTGGQLGGFIGMLGGGFIGGIAGVGVALVTRLFFYPLRDIQRYHRWMQRVAALITTGSSWLLLTELGVARLTPFAEVLRWLDAATTQQYLTLLWPLVGGLGSWLELLSYLTPGVTELHLLGLMALGLGLYGGWASQWLIRWYANQYSP